jgi:hypothetical protein
VKNLLALSLFAVLGVSSANATILYQENFDSFAADSSIIGQNGWTGETDNVAKIINNNGSQALGLRGSNRINLPDFNWQPGNSGEVLTLEWDMSISPDITGANGTFADMGMYNEDGLITDESLFYSSQALGAARETGFHYKMVMDSSTGWLKYYMNDIEVNNSWNGTDGSNWNIKNVQLATFNMSDDGYVTIDNIKVSTNSSTPVPEPATMAVLGFGALATLRRRKK